VEDARGVVDEMREGVFQGAISQALLHASEAAIAALDGRAADARTGFIGAFDELRRLRQLQDLVRWEVQAISLLPDAPEAAAWSEEATEVSQRVGAAAVLQRLAAIRATPSQRPTANTRSEATVSEPS
jgi:hypothetical protein